MKYKTLHAYWSSGGVLNHVKMHDCTIEEVAKAAIEMGYKKPKWYEFWKQEIRISEFSYYENNQKDKIAAIKREYTNKLYNKYKSYSDYE